MEEQENQNIEKMQIIEENLIPDKINNEDLILEE